MDYKEAQTPAAQKHGAASGTTSERRPYTMRRALEEFMKHEKAAAASLPVLDHAYDLAALALSQSATGSYAPISSSVENDEMLRELCFDYRNASTTHAENYFQRIVRWVKQKAE